MVDAHNAARVLLQDVAAADRCPCSATAARRALLAGVLDVGRAAAAAELLGIADEVFERTLDYLKERKQFGKLIGEFQALQHRAATLYVDIEMARAALAKALQALDGDAAAGRRGGRRRQGQVRHAPRRWRCRKACRCTAAWA